MAADIKSQQLFFVGKFFVVAPGRNNALSRCRSVGFVIEQANLSNGAIALRRASARERFVDDSVKFSALTAEKIERAGFDQTLQHFAIGVSRSDSSTKIFQRRVIPCSLPFFNRHLHCHFANVLDCRESVSNCYMALV